jgi:3-deoxy-manno-octulosonate cytidylyltransferase (CMP-KDO synthetase)
VTSPTPFSSESRRDGLTVVIPARMASSRFPGKPLAPILGLPMVEHVRRRALLARGVRDVVVATCDASIFDAIGSFGGRAVMTADSHERCTDRVHEAMLALPGDLVVMVQGDEPLLVPEAIERVAKPLIDLPEVGCTNLLSPLESDADLTNPNIVKAVCAQDGRVMFFSRSPIPSYRKRVTCPVYRQTGIMGFRADLLRRYADLPETPFEQAESVDMLRLLEHGLPIHGVLVDYPTVGVDRPEDVPAVEAWLRGHAQQKALYERTLVMP